MRRELMFPDGEVKNQKRFELLYGAVLLGGSQQPGGRGGIEVLRREARVLDALDAASDPDPDPAAPRLANDEPARRVRAGAALQLDQPDFDLLKKRLEETPWLPKVARDVVDTVDWLSAAPELKQA